MAAIFRVCVRACACVWCSKRVAQQAQFWRVQCSARVAATGLFQQLYGLSYKCIKCGLTDLFQLFIDPTVFHCSLVTVHLNPSLVCWNELNDSNKTNHSNERVQTENAVRESLGDLVRFTDRQSKSDGIKCVWTNLQ